MSSTETIDYSTGELRTYSDGLTLIPFPVGRDQRGELVVVCQAEAWELILNRIGFKRVEENA